MDAGFISFRLCNRDYDCEHCLLNAALCGQPCSPDSSGDDSPDTAVPDDRLYCPGHTWLRAVPGDPTTWRFGLDPFAAAILGNAISLSWPASGNRLDAGDTACRIVFDSGEVLLAAPVPCRFTRPNHALRADPGRLIADPCDTGWVAELRITDLVPLPGLLSATAASHGIRLDLTRFRHAVALELLSHACASSAASLRAGRTLADVPRLLGAGRYLRLLREFVH
jgi:glycine cleavage system H lipoate-binding protein